MVEPGRDEISQGMDHRHSAVTAKLISIAAAQRTRLRGPRALIAAGAAAVLVIGAVAIAVVVSRPSYPHAWCGPLLSELHVPAESDLGHAAALASLQRRDHAPVGRLLADLDDYTVARSVVTDQTGQAPSGSVTGMASTFSAVQVDLQALNRECGQPPGAYQGDSF